MRIYTTRRALVRAGLLLAFAPAGAVAQRAAKPPEKQRPQPGDALVFADGDRKGEKLLADHLERDAAPLLAYPVDPAGVIRDGSRLNQVLVLRLEPAQLTPKVAARASEGIVAYSAVCTHTGCAISGWRAEELRLVCPCHGSEFDVLDGAKALNGPASKPLAMLPLSVEAGELRVARGFTRRVGFTPQ